MDKLKFAMFSIIALALTGLVVYWSIATIQSGTEHNTSQKIEQLENENEELKKEVASLESELRVFTIKPEEPAPNVIEELKPVEPTVYKNQALINELQKLVTENVFMKLKSSGTRVGTVQKFLNLYNKTSNKIDNDFGASTQTAVKAFQKDQGLSADGEAGPTTFNKMIDWLKKQG